MGTYYCVTSTFDDRGRVNAAIMAVRESPTKPEDAFYSGVRRDIYHTWFETYEEAEAYVKEARRA